MTRLTFGIPVYNGERFLPAALDSVRAQDIDDIRVVISDNGSTDGTQEYCRAAAGEDDRIEYHRYDENSGGIWNFGNVLALAKTELFSWMAADDIKLPGFARHTIEALDRAGRDAVFACPRTQIIDADGVVFEDLNDLSMGLDAAAPHERIRNLLRAQASHPMYGVMRLEALRKTRGIRSSLGDDVVLLVELLCQGTMALAPQQLFWQRRHDAQVSVHGVASTSWFAPGTKANRSFAETRTNIELYGGIAHSTLGACEKVRCWSVLGPSWVFPRWRAVARDIANAVGIDPGTGRLRAQQARRRSVSPQRMRST
ncbi:glycosyltransferase family A protein [Microbacterium sp. MPKO10]|uniref:glycosyltransferase family 2 protein n=1 Tax=Microbacterium sp. MPKO10 TaxID=2989818 RepID=UPI00223579AD|nr:glycosyltransferase family A protein [Microbacterium sp. MPKO10]MCW4458852.1 glycosyltransferase [Microbacterium sp. MPKO10]